MKKPKQLHLSFSNVHNLLCPNVDRPDMDGPDVDNLPDAIHFTFLVVAFHACLSSDFVHRRVSILKERNREMCGLQSLMPLQLFKAQAHSVGANQCVFEVPLKKNESSPPNVKFIGDNVSKE